MNAMIFNLGLHLNFEFDKTEILKHLCCCLI